VKNLAVFFPGRKYSVDCPLLYYSDFLLSVNDYKIKHLNYSKNRNDLTKMDLEKEVKENIEYAYNELWDIDFSKYDEIVFVAKSIGTIISLMALKKLGLKNVKLILMTPLEQSILLLKEFDDEVLKECIIIAGDRDDFIDFNIILEFTKDKNIPLIKYNNLGHSLENDNPYESILIVSEIIKEIERFLWRY